MDPKLKNNLLNFETYQRFALMLVFVLIYSIVEIIVYAVALFQIIYLLFTGNMHIEVKKFAKGITAYLYDIVKFLTFDSEKLPFPFEPWSYSNEPEKPETKKSEADA